MSYARAKDALYNYRRMILDISELCRLRSELLQKLGEVPSCISKYGGRMPGGESSSAPEQYAMRNETAYARYCECCADIEAMQSLVDKIDYAFHAVLTGRQREVCHMKFLDGMSYADIAGLYERDERVIKGIVARAVFRIASVMG